ncbi:MAG: hypothetical protein AMXMBFR83_06720 [Phycisphaerae bacterium]
MGSMVTAGLLTGPLKVSIIWCNVRPARPSRGWASGFGFGPGRWGSGASSALQKEGRVVAVKSSEV